MTQELEALQDPTDRARRAHELLEAQQALVAELSRFRREALEEMRASGMTQTEMGEAIGVTRSRISQLVSSGPPPERAFLGNGKLTVALGGKVEAGKDEPGPVVAQEDMAAYDRFRRLAQGVKLEASYEVIPPPGMVHLNRDNLIVICGPRLSPLIAQILESDPHLGFERDDEGWYLVDRFEDRTYRSPIDRGKSEDVAYFGRLPRPDGRGTFLYIAGIHAAGAAGVVHWLEREMADLYRDVKKRRFSTLITCEFDPSTREIRTSDAATPIYRPDS